MAKRIIQTPSDLVAKLRQRHTMSMYLHADHLYEELNSQRMEAAEMIESLSERLHNAELALSTAEAPHG